MATGHVGCAQLKSREKKKTQCSHSVIQRDKMPASRAAAACCAAPQMINLFQYFSLLVILGSKFGENSFCLLGCILSLYKEISLLQRVCLQTCLQIKGLTL